MTVPTVPTLSTIGWTTDPAVMFDYAFADFMTSNYSQSVEYVGSIASLPWVIQKTAQNTSALQSIAQQTLENHLTGLFEVVQVRAEVRDHPTQVGAQQLIFYVGGMVDGKPYNFVRAIENIESKTLQLFELNNG